MDFDYLKIIVTIALAVMGWMIGHCFTERTALAAKRRDLCIEHLIHAYRVLTSDISHRDLDAGTNRKLEDLLADIQLFGSTEQVRFACTLIDEFASGKAFELDPLINNMREDLRVQLQLEPVCGNVKWLRYVTNNDEKTAG